MSVKMSNNPDSHFTYRSQVKNVLEDFIQPAPGCPGLCKGVQHLSND